VSSVGASLRVASTWRSADEALAFHPDERARSGSSSSRSAGGLRRSEVEDLPPDAVRQADHRLRMDGDPLQRRSVAAVAQMQQQRMDEGALRNQVRIDHHVGRGRRVGDRRGAEEPARATTAT